MHTGSRAFCFLMALAATGAECVSAATPASAIDAGHYRVESAQDSAAPSSVMVANHLLAVLAVSHVLAGSSEVTTAAATPSANAPVFSVLDAQALFIPAPVQISQVYDADGRCLASIADANERQLLFVKTTRG